MHSNWKHTNHVCFRYFRLDSNLRIVFSGPPRSKFPFSQFWLQKYNLCFCLIRVRAPRNTDWNWFCFAAASNIDKYRLPDPERERISGFCFEFKRRAPISNFEVQFNTTKEKKSWKRETCTALWISFEQLFADRIWWRAIWIVIGKKVKQCQKTTRTAISIKIKNTSP